MINTIFRLIKRYTVGLDYQYTKPRYIKCTKWNLDKPYYVRIN